MVNRHRQYLIVDISFSARHFLVCSHVWECSVGACGLCDKLSSTHRQYQNWIIRMVCITNKVEMGRILTNKETTKRSIFCTIRVCSTPARASALVNLTFYLFGICSNYYYCYFYRRNHVVTCTIKYMHVIVRGHTRYRHSLSEYRLCVCACAWTMARFLWIFSIRCRTNAKYSSVHMFIY